MRSPILDAVFVSIPENWGDGRWEVPLRDILESQEVIGEGCPVPMPEECPQLAFSELLDPETVQHFVDAWQALELSAQKAGGSLVIRSAEQSAFVELSEEPTPNS
ncbi:MAG: hypothetical protein JST54_15330 [Deltaproteobacteria bacterium]|nr:hypothetical protein [Deltaproteobacteria bacterium]